MRTILIEMEIPLPPSKDIAGLYTALREPLGLKPVAGDQKTVWEADVQKIMQGLISATQGIGSLRTHVGDAHGREKGHIRIDSRIARLAIHASSTVALFLIETWERKKSQK